MQVFSGILAQDQWNDTFIGNNEAVLQIKGTEQEYQYQSNRVKARIDREQSRMEFVFPLNSFAPVNNDPVHLVSRPASGDPAEPVALERARRAAGRSVGGGVLHGRGQPALGRLAVGDGERRCRFKCVYCVHVTTPDRIVSMISSKETDKRIAMRFDKAFQVHVYSELFGDMQAVARNISDGGIGLEMHENLPMGTVVTIR